MGSVPTSMDHYWSMTSTDHYVPEVSKKNTTPFLPFRSSQSHGEFSALKCHMGHERNLYMLQNDIREREVSSTDGTQLCSLPLAFWTKIRVTISTLSCVLELDMDHRGAGAFTAPSFWIF